MSSNSIGPLPKKSDPPSKEVKKASGSLPKKSYATIEKVKKSSGYLDDIEKPLVTNIYTVEKEGTIETVDKKRKSKPNVVEYFVTSPISAKKKIDTFNKTEKSQTSNKTVPTSKQINRTQLNQ